MKTLKRLIKEGNKVFGTVITVYFQKNHAEFGYTDGAVLGLFENLIKHSDTMVFLLEHKRHSSLDPLLRTAFENFVYLKFIFQKDTDRRARSYVLSTKIKEIGLLEKLTEDSLDGVKLRNFMGLDKDTVTKEFNKGIDDDYKESVFNTYLNDIGMSRKGDPWYRLDKKTNNLKDVCSQLDMSIQYNILYPLLSTETHGKDAIRNFHFEENRVDLLNVLKNEDLYISLSTLYIMESIELIYKHYGLKQALKSFNTLFALNYRFK